MANSCSVYALWLEPPSSFDLPSSRIVSAWRTSFAGGSSSIGSRRGKESDSGKNPGESTVFRFVIRKSGGPYVEVASWLDLRRSIAEVGSNLASYRSAHSPPVFSSPSVSLFEFSKYISSLLSLKYRLRTWFTNNKLLLHKTRLLKLNIWSPVFA